MILPLILAASGALWLGPKPPVHVKRVVTIAPSLTDTVVALGAKDLLVGVSRFDELPQVAALPRVGGLVDPSVETVVTLKPDLVVVQKAPGNQQPIEKLASLGVSVLALPLTTVADSLEAIRELGQALEHPREAAALVSEIEATRARMREAAKKRGKAPTVLLVYGFAPLVVAGPGSFGHELLLDCGARNIVEKSVTAYPVYSLERAVALAPDLVIDAADVSEGMEEVRALPQLKRARWVSLPSKDLMHPGPALGRVLPLLCELLIGSGPDAGTERR